MPQTGQSATEKGRARFIRENDTAEREGRVLEEYGTGKTEVIDETGGKSGERRG